MIAVTGKTRGRWSAARKNEARDDAEVLGDLQRMAVRAADRAADKVERVARSPLGVGVIATAGVVLGSLTDIKL